MHLWHRKSKTYNVNYDKHLSRITRYNCATHCCLLLCDVLLPLLFLLIFACACVCVSIWFNSMKRTFFTLFEHRIRITFLYTNSNFERAMYFIVYKTFICTFYTFVAGTKPYSMFKCLNVCVCVCKKWQREKLRRNWKKKQRT